MMADTESWAQTAAEASRTEWGGAAQSELALRNAMEAFFRQRYPDHRICHEMVMGEGKVRADMVAIGADHIAAVEVKGHYDTVIRLLHQVGMYQLCVPEVWMVLDQNHAKDGELIRHLLPSVGLITANAGRGSYHGTAPVLADHTSFKVVAEPAPRAPHPEMMLRMMWAQELANVVTRLRLMAFAPSKVPARRDMVDVLLEKCTVDEMLREICIELRSRHALWRADPVKSNPGAA